MPFEDTERINPSVSMTMVSENQLDEIFEAALTVLSKTGFKMTHDGAKQICRSAGCQVDANRVRVPRIRGKGSEKNYQKSSRPTSRPPLIPQ